MQNEIIESIACTVNGRILTFARTNIMCILEEIVFCRNLHSSNNESNNFLSVCAVCVCDVPPLEALDICAKCAASTNKQTNVDTNE